MGPLGNLHLASTHGPVTSVRLRLIAIGVVLVALATVIVGRSRSRKGLPSKRAYAGAALDSLVAASLLGVLALTLLPASSPQPRADLLPFQQLWLNPSRWEGIVAQMAANVLMFVPLGLFVPARWRALDHTARIVAFAAGFSLLIEAWQFAFVAGRQSSFTDVVLNTGGAVLGYMSLRFIRTATLPRSRPPAAE